mmetsp:Transcript_15685/g.37248  ORF Transcript_15685/g.37248 Transcript_15685/m.37248 type:complete len:114 (+) Transcript_15685:4374-4715(+)
MSVLPCIELMSSWEKDTCAKIKILLKMNNYSWQARTPNDNAIQISVDQLCSILPIQCCKDLRHLRDAICSIPRHNENQPISRRLLSCCLLDKVGQKSNPFLHAPWEAGDENDS